MPFYRQVQFTFDPANEREMAYIVNAGEGIKLWEFYDGWIYINETKDLAF